MTITADILIIILLGITVYQDFKDRSIDWYLIPALLIAFVVKGIILIGHQQLIHFSLLNTAFILFQLFFLTLYFSVKNKKLTNIVNKQLGIGDILFFLVLASAFSPLNYILFFFAANFLALAGFGIYRLTNKTYNNYIPLAGAMALCLMANIILFRIYHIDNFYTDILLIHG